MILGGKNALTKSEYILNNISIDKIRETIPEELKHIYNLSNSQTQNLENFKSFRKRAKIKEAGNLLNIQLLDHLIIYDSDYYSFADNGLL